MASTLSHRKTANEKAIGERLLGFRKGQAARKRSRVLGIPGFACGSLENQWARNQARLGLRLGFRVQDRDGCATTSGWRQATARWMRHGSRLAANDNEMDEPRCPAVPKAEPNTSENMALVSRFDARRLAGAMNWRISRNMRTMHACSASHAGRDMACT
ncbi:hypothetical protein LX36DRAFT_241757 [Colletotrichum falcatum]|nr:hypothetical protein LX36DRAFT_241757 [Colletotrichum falcatum]